MLKLNSLNYMDKGFFGTTLAKAAKQVKKGIQKTNLKMDSIDDFAAHFRNEIISFQPSITRKVDNSPLQIMPGSMKLWKR